MHTHTHANVCVLCAIYAFLLLYFTYFNKFHLPFMKIVSERIFRGAKLDGI